MRRHVKIRLRMVQFPRVLLRVVTSPPPMPSSSPIALTSKKSYLLTRLDCQRAPSTVLSHSLSYNSRNKRAKTDCHQKPKKNRPFQPPRWHSSCPNEDLC
ncbi:hypothetical protein SISNIDRAFT_261597 [Sistotremastrum niveocremeum HHB9708]|uniref:Uncharacterized protein n=2 Tax=Sistotremastraceae TaxID=3402574 RepID=A0A164PAL3_9AGAM|nr:hypothetical protein SISNIDRAFT_261597 [Sistotremastrum niveocremeum HHB9708]KZT33060.1 hypothetical protein SISSUDRAFT_445372 [Sistotremastrum suecicum HHB10207 ss-3]